MGLAVSPGWFQPIMLHVCEGLERVRLFIDDIVCFSSNRGEHVNDLRKLLERLAYFNLKLTPKKAHFGVKVVKGLDHRITAKGIEPDPGKVEALLKIPMPTNVSQLRSLMGAVSHYRKKMPKMAAETKTLNALLKKGTRFEFSAKHTQIVQTVLERLSSPSRGNLGGPAVPINHGRVRGRVGRHGTTCPISFLSRATLPTKKMERDRT